MIYEGFVGPAYRSASINAAGDRLLNLYPELVESGTGKAKYVLYGTPGLSLFAVLPKSPIRAMWAGDNRMFVVAGDTLYEVFANGTNAEVGTLNNNANPATIVSNGSALMIISGTEMFIADGSTVYAPNFDDTEDPVTAVAGAYLDGYFIVLRPDSNQINISNLLGITWDAAEYAIRLGGQDRMMSIYVDHQQLWMFGQKTTELWYNSGDPDFPFQRIEGSWIDKGLWARYSIAKLGESIMWLAGDDRGVGQVVMAQGYTPKRISTFAVEYAIRSYATTTDAIAFCYQQDGHSFYVLTFPTVGKTWVYDLTTQLWHERGSLSGGNLTYWRGLHHCTTFASGTNFVGDALGNIYVMARTYYSDAGTAIRRIRQAPHLSNEQKVTLHHSFQLDMEVGTNSGTPPTLSLAVSDDGGSSFGNEISGTAAAVGDYKKRVIWRRLGRSRDRVYRVTTEMTDPVEFTAAYLGISQGDGS